MPSEMGESWLGVDETTRPPSDFRDMINAASEDVIGRVSELTNGELADVVVDACGLHETANQTFHCLKMQGTVCIFGMPHGDPVFPFDWGTMYMKLPTIHVTNSARSGDVVDVVKAAVDLIAQGRIDPGKMITHDVPFSDVGRAAAPTAPSNRSST